MAIGTFALVLVIFSLTQAGFNPARDLVPQLFAMAAGWGAAAVPDAGRGFLTIYVLGPIVDVRTLLPGR